MMSDVTNLSSSKTLAAVLPSFSFAYLLSHGGQGAPRTLAVEPVLEGNKLVITEVGEKTQRNLVKNNVVGLVWPPLSFAEYSLIVDGQASIADGRVEITPTRAVLHRPQPRPSTAPADSCTSDCMELELP